MKLNFRVRYDTDVDKVRKVVKKIYKELLADEEFGPKLIGKLKSQGVLQMDELAMIMRVKLTTPPGEQFVMHKEIPDSSKDNQSVSDKRLKGAAVAGIFYEEENTVDDGSDDR